MSTQRFIRHLPKSAWLVVTAAYLLSVTTANAVVLPWLDDPWKTTEKVSGFGARSKPVSCPPLPDMQKPLTINQVVIAVLCHNPDARSAYLSLLSSAASYGGNFAAYMPDISATLSTARSTTFDEGSKATSITRSSGITAAMTLYDFGQRELGIESAELSLIAAGHSYDSTLQGFIATALQSYYTLLIAQNAVDISKEAERFARESFEAATLRHEIGLAPLADKLQAKGSYSQAQLGIQQIENSLSQAQATLAILMGLQPDAGIVVAELDDTNLMKDPFNDQVKALMEIAKEKRVDLAASRAGLKSAEIGYESLKRSNLATVSAGVNAGFDDADVFNNSTGRTQSIGVSVSIPIFTGFSQTYAESASKRSIAAQRESLAKSELTVEQDVWSAWHNYQTAKQSWDVSWDQLASATELKDVALGRYQEGLGTILDVLSAQNQYSSALQSQLQTRLALLTARIDLIRAVGVLDLDTMQPRAAAAEPPAVITPPPADDQQDAGQ